MPGVYCTHELQGNACGKAAEPSTEMREKLGYGFLDKSWPDHLALLANFTGSKL